MKGKGGKKKGALVQQVDTASQCLIMELKKEIRNQVKKIEEQDKELLIYRKSKPITTIKELEVRDLCQAIHIHASQVQLSIFIKETKRLKQILDVTLAQKANEIIKYEEFNKLEQQCQM